MNSKQATELWFVRQNLPCLVMGSSRADTLLSSIDVDYEAICNHAGALLLRRGHNRIALVLPEGIFGGHIDCVQGLKGALDQSPNARLQVMRHNGSSEHICNLLDKALKQKNPPSAFLVAHASHALTVYVHLLYCGKRIPKDVAVISCDDEVFLNSVKPAISRYVLGDKKYIRRLTAAVLKLATPGIHPRKAVRLIPDFFPGDTV